MDKKQPPIIDSHIHLFNDSHLPHLAWATPQHPLFTCHSIPEYLSSIPPEQRTSFKGFVFVETDHRHTIPTPEAIQNNDVEALTDSWKWTLAEFEFGYELSLQSELVRGVVPWAPMNLGTLAMERYLPLLLGNDEHTDGRRKLLKGFRYLVQDKPSGTINTPDFIAAMEWAWRRGLVVEVGVDIRSGGIWQLEEAVEAIERIVTKEDIPSETGAFVISMFPHLTSLPETNPPDHLGKPNLHITPAEIFITTNETFDRWSTLLTRLAATHPSIAIKLSGVFSELPHDPKHYTAPSAEYFILDQVQPWAERALKVFGPWRVLWATDWPVCKLGFEKMFPELEPVGAWECWRRLTVGLLEKMKVGEGSEEESAIWGGNAVRVYRLDVEL